MQSEQEVWAKLLIIASGGVSPTVTSNDGETPKTAAPGVENPIALETALPRKKTYHNYDSF